MSHTFVDDTYAPGHIAGTDIENITNNFNILRETFAATTSPVNAVAGMLWSDTDNYLLKIRDQANANWLGAMMGNASTTKIGIYNNSTDDGWVDGTGALGDRIFAIKGGSVYTTGGANAGTWTISDIATDSGTGSHNHQIYKWVASNASKFYDSNGDEVLISGLSSQVQQQDGFVIDNGPYTSRTLMVDLYTDLETHSHTVTSDGAWRPAAAVVTLQYLNV